MCPSSLLKSPIRRHSPSGGGTYIGHRSHSTAHSFTASLEDFHYHQIGHTTSQSSTLPSDVSLTLLPLRRLRLGGQLLPRPTCSTLGPLHRCITTQHTTTPCSHDKPALSTRTHSAPFSPPPKSRHLCGCLVLALGLARGRIHNGRALVSKIDPRHLLELHLSHQHRPKHRFPRCQPACDVAY